MYTAVLISFVICICMHAGTVKLIQVEVSVKMDAIADDSSSNLCSSAVTFIASFATLFIISLIMNFVVVSILVAMVCRERKREQEESYVSSKKSRNLYTLEHANMMWSDEAPRYIQEVERSLDEQENVSESQTSEESDKLEDDGGQMKNPHYVSIDKIPAKKTVRFTPV